MPGSAPRDTVVLRDILEVLKFQLTQEQLISLKLNCLQPRNETLDESDLDEIDQQIN